MPESGLPVTTDRRTLLKRSAIVGGALVWTTPVVQSIGSSAFAAGSGGGGGGGPTRRATLTISKDTDTGPASGGPQNANPGGLDKPQFDLQNNSDPGVLLTGFKITIGDTSYNYDYVRDEQATPGVGFTLVTPDRAIGGVRSNMVEYNFTGFTPTRSFSFEANIDPDVGTATTNFRQILFNNGAAPNAQATFTFSVGAPITITLPDGPTGQLSYSYVAVG